MGTGTTWVVWVGVGCGVLTAEGLTLGVGAGVAFRLLVAGGGDAGAVVASGEGDGLGDWTSVGKLKPGWLRPIDQKKMEPMPSSATTTAINSSNCRRLSRSD